MFSALDAQIVFHIRKCCECAITIFCIRLELTVVDPPSRFAFRAFFSDATSRATGGQKRLYRRQWLKNGVSWPGEFKLKDYRWNDPRAPIWPEWDDPQLATCNPALRFVRAHTWCQLQAQHHVNTMIVIRSLSFEQFSRKSSRSLPSSLPNEKNACEKINFPNEKGHSNKSYHLLFIIAFFLCR